MQAKFDPESLCRCLFFAHRRFFAESKVILQQHFHTLCVCYSIPHARGGGKGGVAGEEQIGYKASPPPLFCRSSSRKKKGFPILLRREKGGYIRKTLEDEKGRMTVREEKEIAGFALLLLLFTLSNQQTGKRSSTFHRKTKIFL